MKPDLRSNTLLGITRSKAKMIEFSIPTEYRIAPARDPDNLFPLTIGIIGDFAAGVAREDPTAASVETAKQELRFLPSSSMRSSTAKLPKPRSHISGCWQARLITSAA
ncbi:MAG: hypothetical protein H0X34_15520 [Chthoniobacterales bacterium]|nr:hypothetical protein [Chthoniobacterales bacterium]